MAKPYSPQQRAAALAYLVSVAFDFQRAAAETGVGERTLQRWAKRAGLSPRQENSIPPPPPPPPPSSSTDPPAAIDDALYHQIIASIHRLVALMESRLDELTPAQQVRALQQITATLERLRAISPPAEERIGRIVFEDPDGTLHRTPLWARDDSVE